jgi:hypothetical protein
MEPFWLPSIRHYLLDPMSLSLPFSEPAVAALAEAIFAKPLVAVIETDSFDAEPRRFTSAAELFDYVAEQRTAPRSSVLIGILYADMGGQLYRSKHDYAPELASELRYHVTVKGWGLLRVYLDLRGGRALGSSIAVNSQKRAEKWMVTLPELDFPCNWNWPAVASHERRLARVLKKLI